MDFNKIDNKNLTQGIIPSGLEKAPFEVRQCHTIGEFKKLRESSKVHPQFEFEEIAKDGKIAIVDGLPTNLVEGEIYNITSWNSLHIVKAVGPNSFEIVEAYGDTFSLDKKYLLIETCY